MSATSSDTDPVDAIVDLLSGAASSTWDTANDPDVFRWHDRTEQERGPGDGQAPHLYVWQPTGGPIERFSADGDLFWSPGDIVEVHVYTLDEDDTQTLSENVITFLSNYISDQEQNTEFTDIQPSNVEDFREQKLRKHTDHFVYRVEVTIQKYRDTA